MKIKSAYRRVSQGGSITMNSLMQQKRFFHGMVFVLFLGLMPLITGCGSSSNNGTTTTTTLPPQSNCNTTGANFNISGFNSQAGPALQNLAAQLKNVGQ